MSIEIEDPITETSIVLTSLDQTCFACPSQWDAMTDAGERVYVRYRWGTLTVELTPPGASQATVGLEDTLGDTLAGVIGFAEIEHLVARGIGNARHRFSRQAELD